MGRVRASVRGVAAVLVILALSGLGASAAHPAPAVEGYLTTNPAGGPPKTTITLAGKVAPWVKHEVKLQRRDHGGFVTLARKNTDTRGRFTFSTTLPGGRSDATYRVFSPRTLDPTTGSKRAYVTPERTVIITSGKTIRITRGNGGSGGSSMSANGRYVAFVSGASNLVPGDTNRDSDVFVWDSTTGTTRRITDGRAVGLPDISADGQFVTYIGDSGDVFVWNRATGKTTHNINGDNGSAGPAISANGRYVAFVSYATNLVPGDTNERPDVFVWDRAAGITSRITDSDGWSVFAPAISADGRYISFSSDASNLVPGGPLHTNDVFVWDGATGITAQLTNGNVGSYSPTISADGRYISSSSDASNLVAGDTNNNADVFVWDRTTRITTRVTDGNQSSSDPVISADGRHISFTSWASDLDPQDMNREADMFVWDRATRTTRITYGNDSSFGGTISSDGRYISYQSSASDLVAGDTNGVFDIFVWTRGK